MVGGGLGVQTRVTVSEVVKPVAVGPLGLRNGRTATGQVLVVGQGFSG
jgi:hypothetical protein